VSADRHRPLFVVEGCSCGGGRNDSVGFASGDGEAVRFGLPAEDLVEAVLDFLDHRMAQVPAV
jgi:hypothetical protein